MTDNTQPEALRLATASNAMADEGEMIHLLSWHEIRNLLRANVAELRRQHARIAELEAQLSSSGFSAADMATAAAQGFRDGVTSVAASAGSEAVAIYHGRYVIDYGAHKHLDMELLKMIPAGTKLYTHPSPPEGMAGWKWVPVEPTEEMLAAAHDGDREYTLRNFGDVMTVMQGPYDHWAAMLAAAPPPPAQAADSVLEDAARESEYRRGYRHGYEQRDAEVRGALA